LIDQFHRPGLPNPLIDQLNTSDRYGETISQQNPEVQLSTENEDVTISHRIQIHQNVSPNQMNQVVTKYPAVWSNNEGVVDISEEFWMQICLKDNWEFTGTKLKHKLYSVPANE